MTFLVILAMLFFGIASPIVVHRKLFSYNGQYLSRPARDTLRLYRSLPADNRVVSEWEIKSSLAALDTKANNNHKQIEKHFSRMGWETSKYTFPQPTDKCSHLERKYSGSCFYHGYTDMYREMKLVQQSLSEREREIALNRVSSALNDVSAITARFRQERELIDDVTKEIV